MLGVGSHNTLSQEDAAARVPLIKTATYTITVKNLMTYKFFIANHASVTVAFTLPAAAAELAGMVRYFANKAAAAATVAVSAGFGGGTTTVTLAQGDACCVLCDGTYWYVVSETSVA